MTDDFDELPDESVVLDAAEALHEILEHACLDTESEAYFYFSLVCTRAGYHENPDEFIKFLSEALDAALHCPEFDQAMTLYTKNM